MHNAADMRGHQLLSITRCSMPKGVSKPGGHCFVPDKCVTTNAHVCRASKVDKFVSQAEIEPSDRGMDWFPLHLPFRHKNTALVSHGSAESKILLERLTKGRASKDQTPGGRQIAKPPVRAISPSGNAPKRCGRDAAAQEGSPRFRSRQQTLCARPEHCDGCGRVNCEGIELQFRNF